MIRKIEPAHPLLTFPELAQAIYPLKMRDRLLFNYNRQVKKPYFADNESRSRLRLG
jgi:hypothetical protein